MSSQPAGHELLKQIRDPATTLAQLSALWLGQAQDPLPWRQTPALFVALAERLLGWRALGSAQEVIAAGLELDPNQVRLRQLQGLAAARSGAVAQANQILLGLERAGHADAETLGILASTFKELALAATDPMSRRELLEQSQLRYKQAYEARPEDVWTGINAATLALLLDRTDEAHLLADRVRGHCFDLVAKPIDQDPDRYWSLATLGEAELVAGSLGTAEMWYTRAVRHAGNRYGDLVSTRKQARLLLAHLGHSPERADRWLPVPKVAVFVGHMIDAPDRPVPRFPSELAKPVAAAIREAVRAAEIRIGYASAAAGGDLLFHEAIAGLGGEARVVLPYDEARFVPERVDIVPGADWKDRFARVLQQASQVVTVSPEAVEFGGVSYDYANMVLEGLARVRAAELATEMMPMALWDGRPSRRAGGVGAVIERWRAAGLQPVIVDLAKLQPPRCEISGTPEPRAASTVTKGLGTRPRILALLFADGVGFSALNDAEIQRFLPYFLNGVATLIDRDRDAVAARETWGDGLYLAFKSVRDAGLFALDLCQWMNDVDWPAAGVPRQMLVRIALHAGPVFELQNPVTGLVNFTGAHVTRCARIEPMTSPGQVFASQAFAALAAYEHVREFTCRFVKQAAWAKSYGTFPTYLVERRGLDR